jgi:3-deoxy-7-phosphoheptulonate synthase
VLPGVLHVHRISAPYKLAGRAFRPEGTVVEFRQRREDRRRAGAVIAGPCAIENREQIF